MAAVDVDTSALLSSLDDLGLRLAGRLGETFTDLVHSKVPRRTGTLDASISATEPVLSGSSIEVVVTVAEDYGAYQDEGTGIYGPEGTPITPNKPGGFLVFDWPAAGGIVFAKSVRGTTPTHFFTNAVESWPQIVTSVSVGG